MSDDWDFYPLLVDSEPASIYVDLGLAQIAPVRTQPHMGYVRVFMRHPRGDGLSSSEEFEALLRLEDALIDGVAVGDVTTYSGRNTSSGSRDFYFYTKDPKIFAASAEMAMAHHPDYKFKTGSQLDPEWGIYFNFLYPSADDLQRIMNRRVTDNLAKYGDALSKPRPIDHLAYLPNARAAASLRGLLGEQGFTVYEPEVGGGSVMLRFERADRPDAIDDVVIPIARRVKELGGAYDGWGCEVVSSLEAP
ncbi:DUF695 domain-containing protein [Bosea sp. BK604]|uniref:DUF695 domain-containing protein n=1 Tax=Bosea sp. BK604 TaxID=2512180 RepID=UPI001049B985|nr:DUF695 domain-containing protein [Bosea sp. BK604]TCR64915.1 regulator of ribonuclease activity B [Bosea sp. BK604]